MSCVVRVRNQESTDQLLIPNKAVVEEMGEYFVYVAKDTEMTNGSDAAKGNRGLFAFQKKVQLGVTIGPNVIIQGGINSGDRIVAEGIQSLHNGSRIAPSGERPAVQTEKDSGAKKNNPQGTQ